MSNTILWIFIVDSVAFYWWRQYERHRNYMDRYQEAFKAGSKKTRL